jgi:hypothetical protein
MLGKIKKIQADLSEKAYIKYILFHTIAHKNLAKLLMIVRKACRLIHGMKLS